MATASYITSRDMIRPELVILDEPVSALDVSIRSQITNLFCDLQCEYGISYLLVTHDLGTTRFMAHSLAVMYLGRIVEGGPTEEIFDRPRHPYTEALLSAALPSHPDAPETTIELDGEPPSPIDPPSGCHFHPRCHRYLGTVCAEVAPTPQIAGSRRISCHLSDL